MHIQNPRFEALIHDYMADPENNYVFEVKGPVDRIIVSPREDGEPGWSVEYFCQKEPLRPFLIKLTPEDLMGWMWADKKKATA